MSVPLAPAERDDQYRATLLRVFDQVNQWQDALQQGSLFRRPEQHSLMKKADERTRPLQMSHAIASLINVAIEHQHAVATLVGKAGVIHSTVPFTLTRSAVEAASTAIWILRRSDSWREQIKRLVIFHRQDRYDYEKSSEVLTALTGAEMPVTLAKRTEWIDQIIKDCGITDLPRGMKMIDVIKDVEGRAGPDTPVELYWRMSSAFAHARPWASINGLVRTEVEPIAPGVLTLRLESDAGRVLLGSVTAVLLTNDALKLYDEACRKR